MKKVILIRGIQVANARSVNKTDIERYVVFLFGVIFLCTILAIVLINPEPTWAQFFAFKLTLALSAAGVGAMIPGFINFQQKLPFKGLLRCGGAIALFVAVWFTNPAQYAAAKVPPPENGKAVELVNNLMNLMDKKDYDEAYRLFNDNFKASITKETFVDLANNSRDPLGKRTSKAYKTLVQAPEMQQGIHGPFYISYFESTFSNQPGIWVERIELIPRNDKWTVNSYHISRCEPPECKPQHQFN